jgi:putative methyltransferase (TIGR04325 family)
MTFTRILKPILPPFLWSIGKDLKRRLLRSVDHYAYAPQGWNTKLPAGDNNEAYWSAFLERERVLCQALIARVRAGHSILTPDDEVVKYVIFGYVLALAARHKDRLTVIDYGGHLGECYWIATAFLPGVELDYHCKELPAIAAAGRELTPKAIWHTDDACLSASYDVVMFSASLPYLPDWKKILYQAAQSTRGYLLLSDIPSVRNVPSYVITQRSGAVQHLQCLLNRSEIVDTVERAGLRLVQEFTIGTHPPVANAPEQPLSLGWLFRR